jgi:hypothetical protein
MISSCGPDGEVHRVLCLDRTVNTSEEGHKDGGIPDCGSSASAVL